MADPYTLLLEAAIDQLQRLKDDGVRYVPVSSDLLANLSKPVPRPPPARLESASTSISSSHSSALLQSSVKAPALSPPPLLPPAATATKAEVAVHGGPETKDTTATPGSVVSLGENREESVGKLRARALACQKCPHLASSRRNVVFGVGDIHSPLMFVGEAPGADEDAKGEPFVGAAGQLLTKIIQTMGFNRETVYIANVLKCRPDTPGQTSGNRKPTGEEMKTCLPYLLDQIDLIQPKVIVALGATAVEGLLGLATPISKLRGSFQSLRAIPVMTTYHPAYLLRNQALSEKRKLWEDMLMVLEKLGLPVSDKQRGYFLRAG